MWTVSSFQMRACPVDFLSHDWIFLAVACGLDSQLMRAMQSVTAITPSI